MRIAYERAADIRALYIRTHAHRRLIPCGLHFRFLRDCLSRVTCQPPTQVLHCDRSRHPDLPVRKKSTGKHEIARPLQIRAQPPDAERGATDRYERQQTGGQPGQTAIFPRTARNYRSLTEADFYHHKLSSSLHYNRRAIVSSTSNTRAPRISCELHVKLITSSALFRT
jgi:hypothetical protein